MDRKGALNLAFRIALSIGILVFLFLTVDFDTDKLLPEWTTETTVWLVAAFGLTLGALVLSVWRWWEVAQVLEITDVKFSRYLSHYFAGQFLSNFVPTTVGGDFLRVRRLSKDSGQPPASFASVVFERLSGWLILPAISLAGFVLNPGLRRLESSSTLAFVVAGVTLVALVVVILVAGSDRLGRRLERREGWFEWVNAVHLGLDSLRSHPRQIWRVIGSSFGYQLVLLAAAVCAAQALQIDEVGPTALMALFPAVLIVQVLPLGIGGLGIREGALVLFFGPLGVEDERLIAFGFLLYFLTLVSSFVGLPALIFGGRGDASPDESIGLGDNAGASPEPA